MAAYGWIVRKFIRDGEVTTEKLAADSVTAAKIASGAINGSKFATVATVAGAGTAQAVVPGAQSVVAVSIADAASAVYEFTVPFKCKIVDALVSQVGAGNAGNSVVIRNAASTAITNAMNNASDDGVSRCTSLDDGNNTIAAGAVFKVDVTKAGGSAAVVVYLTVIPVA
jgi:hypothetical protein